MHIRKDDKVVVLSGKTPLKNSKGEYDVHTVLSVDPKAGKVIVEGANVATRHKKPRKQGEEGGIVKKETPMYACKVMRVCPKCSQPTRHASKIVDGNKKVRVCKKCGKEI